MKMELMQHIKASLESINVHVDNGLDWLVDDGNIVRGVDSLRQASTMLQQLQDLLKNK